MENVLRGPVRDDAAGCDIWTYGPAHWRDVTEIRCYGEGANARWHVYYRHRQQQWLQGGSILGALAVANAYLEGGKK